MFCGVFCIVQYILLLQHLLALASAVAVGCDLDVHALERLGAHLLNVFLAVLDVDTMLWDALELASLEVKDAVVGLVGHDGADA